MDPISLVSAGGSILGGLAGRSSANRSARAVENAARIAAEEQRRQYETTRADLAPYRGLGQFGAESLQAGIEGGAYDAPEFGFQEREFNYDATNDSALSQALAQANKSIQASAAARGMLGGGGVMRALNREGMDRTAEYENRAYDRFQGEEATKYGRASDAYNRIYGARQDTANRLQGLVGTGLGAATQTGSFGAQAAGNIGELGMTGATQGAAYRGAGTEQLWSGLGRGLGALSGGDIDLSKWGSGTPGMGDYPTRNRSRMGVT